jgi:hypothetical protein
LNFRCERKEPISLIKLVENSNFDMNYSACLGFSVYSRREDPTENTPVFIVTEVCASRFRGNLFTEPLPSNAYSFWRSFHSNGIACYDVHCLKQLVVKSILYGRQGSSFFIFTHYKQGIIFIVVPG